MVPRRDTIRNDVDDVDGRRRPVGPRPLTLCRTATAVVVSVVVAAVAMAGCGSSDTASTTTLHLTGPAAAGQQVVRDLGCTTCHTVDGSDGVGPTFQGLAGSRVHLQGGRTVTADDAYLRRSIRHPSAQVVDGFRPIMPDRELTDAQLSSVIAYLRALGR